MRIRNLVLTLFVVLSLIKAYDAFGPHDPVRLGKETTFVSTPLADDGLPNFAQAVIENQRAGATAENNAAVTMWKVMGADKMSPAQFALVCDELEIRPIPTRRLTPLNGEEVEQSLVDWLAGKGHGGDDHERKQLARDFLARSTQAAWTAEEIPPLARWVEANDDALTALCEAAEKTRFFSPSPSFLENHQASIVEFLLPHAESLRGAARSLSARAAFRVGRADYAGAWSDCRAGWRFGELATDHSALIERVVAMGVRKGSLDTTLTILNADDLTEEMSLQILNDLNETPDRVRVDDALDFSERLLFLDNALRTTTGRLGGAVGELKFENEPSAHMALDLNAILMMSNEWYDRLVRAALIEDLDDRRVELREIDEDIETVAKELKGRYAAAVVSRGKRSEIVGDILTSLLLPAVSSAVDAADRDEANLHLVRTAAALCAWRTREGEYPESLNELVPDLLAEAPTDIFSDQTPIYERRRAGYLLYSVGPNGVDDGGTDRSQPIVRGEWQAGEGEPSYDAEHSDLVIRLPLPTRRFDLVRDVDPSSPRDDNGL